MRSGMKFWPAIFVLVPYSPSNLHGAFSISAGVAVLTPGLTWQSPWTWNKFFQETSWSYLVLWQSPIVLQEAHTFRRILMARKEFEIHCVVFTSGMDSYGMSRQLLTPRHTSCLASNLLPSSTHAGKKNFRIKADSPKRKKEEETAETCFRLRRSKDLFGSFLCCLRG